METKIEMSQIRGLDKGKRNPSGTLLPRIADWWAENEERAVTSHPRHGIAGAGERKGESWVGVKAKRKQEFTARDRLFGFAEEAERVIGTKARLARAARRYPTVCCAHNREALLFWRLSEMRKWEKNGAVR